MKTPHKLDFPCKKYLHIQFIFPFLFTFLGWMSSWAKRTRLGKIVDLKYLNILIGFLVNLSPLTLFDIKLKLIGAITCI